MYLYGVGCLVPTKEWEAEWEPYKANPKSWTPVLSHEEWDNSALQELFLHVWHVPERSVAWDKLVKTCEETIQALLRYRKLLGPDDTSEIDRISGLKISVLAPTTSPHSDEHVIKGATFAIGGSVVASALIYNCDDAGTGVSRMAHELAFSQSSEELSELRRRTALLMRTLDEALTINALYVSEIEGCFPPSKEGQSTTTTINTI